MNDQGDTYKNINNYVLQSVADMLLISLMSILITMIIQMQYCKYFMK